MPTTKNEGIDRKYNFEGERLYKKLGVKFTLVGKHRGKRILPEKIHYIKFWQIFLFNAMVYIADTIFF